MADKTAFFINRLKNKKLAAVSIFVIVAVVLAITGYLVFSGKSARQFYLDAEAKNFKKCSEHIKKIYSKFYKGQEPYIKDMHRSRIELTADIQSEGDVVFGIQNSRSIMDVIRKCKLIIDNKSKPAEKESLTNLSLLVDKSPIIDALIFTGKDKLGFTVPVLTPDRYFTLDLDKIDEVYERFGIPVRPKKIAKKAEFARTIKFSGEELDAMAKEYGSLISGFIAEEDVKYGKDVVLKVGDREVKGREVIVTLGEDKTEELIGQVLDKASGDDRLLRLTYENYADVVGLFRDMGFFQLVDVLDETGYMRLNDIIKKGFLDRLNVSKDLKGFKDSLKEVGSGYKYPDGLKMVLVIDKSGNILERKASVTYIPGKDGEKRVIDIYTGINDVKNVGFNNGFFTLTLTRTGTAGEKLEDTLTVNTRFAQSSENDDGKGRVEIIYRKSRDEDTKFAVKAGVDIEKSTDQLTLKKNTIAKYNMEFQGDRPDITDRFYGEIKTVAGENKKRKIKNVSTGTVLNADMPSFGMKPLTLKLNLAREDRFDIEDFSLPEPEAATTVHLNTASEDDLKKVGEEIMASFGTFYMNNKSLIDAVTGVK